jgi:hypothetical protein
MREQFGTVRGGAFVNQILQYGARSQISILLSQNGGYVVIAAKKKGNDVFQELHTSQNIEDVMAHVESRLKALD